LQSNTPPPNPVFPLYSIQQQAEQMAGDLSSLYRIAEAQSLGIQQGTLDAANRQRFTSQGR
jgi:hypothetical protein